MSADMRSEIEPAPEPDTGHALDTDPGEVHDGIDVVTPEPVEIRGRAGAHAFVALVAGATAVAYAWRISAGGTATLWWALVAVLGLVAVVNLGTWIGARAPLMVADAQGVRVRHGRTWTGIPWSQVASVQVQPATRRLGDAVLVVSPVDGAAQSVAYGTCASVSSEDLPGALAELRHNGENAPVVLTQPATTLEPEADPTPPPAAAPAPERAQPLRMASSLRRAARAQVHRDGPATVGSSALAHEPARLPEISELRRTEGRVGLVIESFSAPAVVAPPVPETYSADAAPGEAYPSDPATEPLIGPVLTQARQQLRLRVDDLSDRTRIRPHVIESIEVDDFVPCGGDFYTRGHLRSLSRTLGIDPAPLLETYDREYAQAPVAARRVFEAELANGPQPSIRRVTGGPRWSALIAVVMVLAIVWAIADYVSGQTTQEPFSAPPDTTAGAPAPSVDPDQFAGLGAPVLNEFRFTSVAGRSDVVVRDSEGDLVWRGALRSGDTQVVDVAGPATVRILDAGNVRVRVNGSARGTLGEPGESVRETLGRRPAP